ncbi:MAG: beta-lactamase family protein, partial [Pyrinomonadaceae bacterium]|nr:beta-lactamase family protein [Pyrinomonadaceae bacterium]
MRHKLFLRGLILLSVCFVPVQPLAQTKPKLKAPRQTEKVDAYVREKMSARHIPGLSLAVVRDGKVILAKGYGMANLELSVSATDKTNIP